MRTVTKIALVGVLAGVATVALLYLYLVLTDAVALAYQALGIDVTGIAVYTAWGVLAAAAITTALLIRHWRGSRALE